MQISPLMPHFGGTIATPHFSGKYIVDNPADGFQPSDRLTKIRKKKKLASFFATPLTALALPIVGMFGGLGVLFTVDADATSSAYEVTQQTAQLSKDIRSDLNTDDKSKTFLKDQGLNLSSDMQQEISESNARQEFYQGFSEINETIALHQVTNLSEATLQKALVLLTPAQIEQADQVAQKVMGLEDSDEKIAVMMDWYDAVLAPNLLKTGDMNQQEIDAVRTETQAFFEHIANESQDEQLALSMVIAGMISIIPSMALFGFGLSRRMRYESEEREELRRLQR